ncbi:MAG TPA: MBL fold metallo-hydrolase RNA specificity domain-containing protein [Tepidisphaeraceae bacterium]|jgi:Cft2 family RNA processing exonuclease
MIDWDFGLRVAGTSLYLDARRPRPISFVSHAHSDHVARHQVALATPETLALAEVRLGLEDSISLPLGEDHVHEHCRVRLYSAGHVLGSAMIRVEHDGGALLYTGDFKLRQSLTVPVAEAPTADVLIMESTYGRPMFRFPPKAETAARLVELVGGAFRDGRQPVVMGYSLGKAQEIVRILTDAGFVVTEHGAVGKLSDVYEQRGVPLGKRRKYVAADFRGPRALPLEERGVLVAPPQVARSTFVSGFDNPVTIMMSGWALLKGAHFRYGVQHVLPLSDHADFDELIELIDRVQPKKILTVHGFPDFVQTLRKRGLDASLARPEAQMNLFE